MNVDFLKLSTDWARAEVFSAKMVWLFSALVLVVAVGFVFWGKTSMAKAFVIPLFGAGLILIGIGAGLYIANKPRIAQFEKEYTENRAQFLEKEIARTTKSDNDFKLVFRVLPLIAIAGAALVLLLPSSPIGRAIGVTVILLVAFLMLLDSQTQARNAEYRSKLIEISN